MLIVFTLSDGSYAYLTGCIRGSQDFKNHVYLVNPDVTSPNVTERAELCPFNMLSFRTASRNGNR